MAETKREDSHFTTAVFEQHTSVIWSNSKSKAKHNCFKQVIIYFVLCCKLKEVEYQNCFLQLSLEILPGVPESLGLTFRMLYDF